MLKKLTKLNASYNQIKELPVEFYRLTELQVLILSHNNIETVSVDFCNLVMLNYLVITQSSCSNFILISFI